MCIDLFPRNPRKRRSLHTSGFLQGRSKRRRSLFPGFTLTDSWTCAIEKTWLGVVKPFGCHSLTWIVKTIVWKLVWSYVSVPRSIFFDRTTFWEPGNPWVKLRSLPATGEALWVSPRRKPKMQCNTVSHETQNWLYQYPTIKPYQWELLWCAGVSSR
jgi:hypothetical protein